jgi:hypothetical protein
MNKAEFMEFMDWAKEQTMRELIYKDEAYKAIDNCFRDGWYRISPADAKMNIRHLVSDANEADRPRGEWIEMYRNGFGNMICMCSNCNFHATKSNFCPNCGADMRKGIDNE